MCASAFFLLCQAHPVLPQALFYQGKTIMVIAGQEPGGLGDLRLKSTLPYLKKHIPVHLRDFPLGNFHRRVIGSSRSGSRSVKGGHAHAKW
jgi:hypothetical protein